VSNVSTEWARSGIHDGRMKKSDHLIGDRVSVRCVLRLSSASGGDSAMWLGGRIIARDAIAANAGSAQQRTRYVVQLDDDRRVVAFDDDVRRFTLSFELFETLERMAS
jgi:hypothetical protein